MTIKTASGITPVGSAAVKLNMSSTFSITKARVIKPEEIEAAYLELFQETVQVCKLRREEI